KPRIIHTHFDPASYIVLLVSWLVGYEARFKNIRSMLYSKHGVSVKDRFELPFKTRILKKMMFRLATHIYTVSNEIKSQFIDVFHIENHTKIKSLYVGVEKNKATQKDKSDIISEFPFNDETIIISCVAFHDRVKGIDVLLKAISLINKLDNQLDFKVL